MRHWLFAFLVPIFLQAGGWDPIPPDVWAIKADSPQGAAGAIYLLDWSRYGVRDTEHRLRVLILSEAGKSAVQFEPFSRHLDMVEGRTVYPDGRETVFNKEQDFSNQEVKQGANNVSQKVVIPPGLTDHCIVDLHWKDQATYLWGKRFERHILRPYPIRHLELHLFKRSPMASAWLRPKWMQIDASVDDDYRIYKFKDLPATEIEPYSSEAWRFSPKLTCFLQFLELLGYVDKGPDTYWQAFANKVIQPEYHKNLETGRKYRALAQEILNSLPADPVLKAQEVVDRLYAKVLNVSALTAAEKAMRTKKDENADINARDLNESADRRWTNGTGMFYLAYKLFVDAGLNPKILRVADRNNWSFQYDLINPHQFDDFLLGIDSSDGKSIYWCDPSVRFLPLGNINPSYQGTAALLIDSKDWTVRPYQVPFQAPDLNRIEYTYEVVPGGDTDSFKVRAQFSGQDAWVQRSSYYSLTQKEAETRLKENLESSKHYSVTRTTITNATERGKPMIWEAEGTWEAQSGRRRQVDPFPAMACPLWVPSAWPSHRTSQVVMMYCSVTRCSSRIQIPEGWRAVLPAPIKTTNTFGETSWQSEEIQDEHGKAVRVTFKVTVSKAFGTSIQERDLRDFLTVIQDAWSKKISLEKEK